MQTIEEYKEYAKQLEGEVGKWHHAYDALMIERNQMAKTLCENKNIIETMATELNELPEEVKTEIQRAHLEMVLNRDFKPIYVNVAPNAPIHKVNFETEAKTPKEECT